MIGQLILALAILVSLHELGHFLAARAFGIRVEKYFIFFDAWGKKLFSFKKGNTEYGIGWLPLGGYVKIAGMVDESLDKEQMKKEPEDWEFRSKPAWQRLIVMVAGVFVNFVLGIFIFSMMMLRWGDVYIPNSAVNDAYGIHPTEYGETIGLEAGDRIVSVNGNEVLKFREIFGPDNLLKDQFVLQVNRDGQTMDILVPDSLKKQLLESKGAGVATPRFRTFVGDKPNNLPIGVGRAYEAGLKGGDRIIMVDSQSTEFFDQFQSALNERKGEQIVATVKRDGSLVNLSLDVDSNGKVGFNPDFLSEFEGKMDTTQFGFFQSFRAGWNESISMLSTQVAAFSGMADGKIAVSKSVMGPIQMAGIFGENWDPQRFWRITAILSLILAVMNLLPIPALDGGHVVFLMYEIIVGKPVSDKFMYVTQVIGMAILFTLMIFIFGNDIIQTFFK